MPILRSSPGSASGSSSARTASGSAEPGAEDRGRPRGSDPEDRRRTVAGVPGRPDLDRRRRRHPGQGTVLIFEKMFENRLFFVDKLVSMGARIILCDPHRAVVTGPAKLYGQRMASPDIRAGMAMLIAGLCAEGVSTIGNIGEIDRGYERIDERLRALGADRASRGVALSGGTFITKMRDVAASSSGAPGASTPHDVAALEQRARNTSRCRRPSSASGRRGTSGRWGGPAATPAGPRPRSPAASSEGGPGCAGAPAGHTPRADRPACAASARGGGTTSPPLAAVATAAATSRTP